jgi:hypothetical protein
MKTLKKGDKGKEVEDVPKMLLKSSRKKKD